MKQKLIRFARLMIFLVFLFPGIVLNAQKKINRDSLLKIALSSRKDTNTINACIRLSKYYRVNVPDSAFLLLRKALSYAIETGATKKVYSAYTGFGVCYNSQTHGDSALPYLLKADSIALVLKDTLMRAEAISNIGIAYFNQLQYAKALEAYLASAKLFERVGDDDVSRVYNNIANLYFLQKDYKMALEYYNQSLKIGLKEKDKFKIASTYSNMALVYNENKQFDTALAYQQKSLRLAEEMGDKFGIGLLNGNIGKTFLHMEKYEKAIEYLKKALVLKIEFGDLNGIINGYSTIGDCYRKLNRNKDAIEMYRKALDEGKNYKYYGTLADASRGLYHAYKAEKNEKNALEALELYCSLNDSAAKQKKSAEFEELGKKYESEKKEAQIKVLEKDHELSALKAAKQDADIKKQRMVIFSISAALVALVILSYFIFKSYRQKKRDNAVILAQKKEVEAQKSIIEEKQKEILDSIYYARRIQRALITNEKYIARNLNKLSKK